MCGAVSLLSGEAVPAGSLFVILRHVATVGVEGTRLLASLHPVSATMRPTTMQHEPVL